MISRSCNSRDWSTTKSSPALAVFLGNTGETPPNSGHVSSRHFYACSQSIREFEK
jgi:hypothetical protein